MTRSQSPRTNKLLRPLQLTAIFFFTVSGGPYGLEPLLDYVGANAAFVLLIVTPLVWSLPVILMVLELNSMFPQRGGYYQWVKYGMGNQWGFLEGWWTLLYCLTDLAIYPVLFVEYLTFFFPGVEILRIPLCLLLIWICAGVNILGIRPTGRSSVVLEYAVLVPFIIMFLYAFFHFNHPILESTPRSFSPKGLTALSMGLFTVMWNYLGWDSASTIAEEVEQPHKSYFSSIFTALSIIVIIYVASLITSQRAGMNTGLLQSNGFPALGQFIGGWWLGALISLGGIASALGLFMSNLLAITRVPEAIADDGFMPKFLSKIHPRFSTPHFSIILCATAVSGMVLWNFADLLIIDVTLYSSALLPEFIALIVLRYKQPLTGRSFKIPFNTPGLIVLTILPTFCIIGAMSGLLSFQNSYQTAMLFALVAILTGPLTWIMIQWAKGKNIFQP